MRASVVEVNKLEKRIPFLATTASIAPFIGLFGTVSGIMMAFQGIGQTGSTNLGVVAPGIADALVATAAGLVAAIPAVISYNHLTKRVQAVRVGDGRLRDGVPEHRREELHLVPQATVSSPQSAAPWRGRPRPPRRRPRSPKSTSCRSST